jgi:hypothetical protein
VSLHPRGALTGKLVFSVNSGSFPHIMDKTFGAGTALGGWFAEKEVNTASPGETDSQE